MICRNCKAQIADKAIVCYRCGTPTADLPPVAPVSQRQAGGSAWLISFLIALIAIAAWWFLPGPTADPLRVVAGVVAVLAVLVGVIMRTRARR